MDGFINLPMFFCVEDGPCLGVVQLINGPFTEEDAELLEDL